MALAMPVCSRAPWQNRRHRTPARRRPLVVVAAAAGAVLALALASPAFLGLLARASRRPQPSPRSTPGARPVASSAEDEVGRGSLLRSLVPASLFGAAAAGPEGALAEEAVAPVDAPPPPAKKADEPVDVPPRISTDPYELVKGPDGVVSAQEFLMQRNYKKDTEQVLKHMKISASLDKGTPNMEKYNVKIKEEMNDWLAMYRRQEKVASRQSFSTLSTSINTLASHIVSYGPKFPFPTKRRERIFELFRKVEKYLKKEERRLAKERGEAR